MEACLLVTSSVVGRHIGIIENHSRKKKTNAVAVFILPAKRLFFTFLLFADSKDKRTRCPNWVNWVKSGYCKKYCI